MSNVKYFYVRNDYKKRDVTIVSDILTDGEKCFVKAAWSFRSNHDKFIKREGRKIALERLKCSDVDYSALIEIEKEDIKFFEIVSRILGTILVKESTPKKYLDDLSEDFRYYTECAVHGRPSWQSVLSSVDRTIPST